MKIVNFTYHFRILIFVLFGLFCLPKESFGAAYYEVKVEKKNVSDKRKGLKKPKKKAEKKSIWLLISSILSGILATTFLYFISGSALALLSIMISFFGILLFLLFKNKNRRAANIALTVILVINLLSFGFAILLALASGE